MSDENQSIRRKAIEDSKRIVVKVGTRLLTDPEQIPRLVKQIAFLREKGYYVILVSSGAVGMGMKTMDMALRPSKLADVQALASIGQSKLVACYENAAKEYGFHVAQLLLTATGLQDRERHLNVMNCINSLWSQGVLPIVNENDAVSVDELKFGDNDILAAKIATMTRSEMTIILTTVEGLYSANEDGELGDRIPVVSEIDDKLISYASGTDDCSMSIGGMISKLRAAELTAAAGDYLWIADGRDEMIINKIFAGEDVGTLFLPAGKKQMQAKKRWIKFFSKRSGKIIIDDGAAKALSKDGRSLLPSGICGVEGNFERGDTVEVCSKSEAVVARGLTNYSSDDIGKIAGLQSESISDILGFVHDEVVIHRNNLAVLKSQSKILDS